MDNSIFLLTDVNLNETLGENTTILATTLLTVVVLLFLVDRGLSIFEKVWDSLSDKIYNPSGDSSDPFAEFTGLDQSVIQVVTDTGVKFEDVGNAILEWYNVMPTRRIECGLDGREFCLQNGLTSKQMGDKMIEMIDFLFKYPKPDRPRYTLRKITNKQYKEMGIV